jgi:hypothetical protein
MWKKKPPATDHVRLAFESIKEHVRQVVLAFQEGSGSQDSPFTADLAIAAIWREIDIRSKSLGALEGTSWFRVEVKGNAVAEFAAYLDEHIDFDTVECAGPRVEDGNAVVYLTSSAQGAVVLFDLLKCPEVVKVRDWRWY